MPRRFRLAQWLEASNPRLHFVPDPSNGLKGAKLVYLGSTLLGSIRVRKDQNDDLVISASAPGAGTAWLDFDTEREALRHLIEAYRPNGTAQYSVDW